MPKPDGVNNPGSPAGDGGTFPESIPYARFKEVNDALQAFKQAGYTAEDLKALKEIGFSLDDMRAYKDLDLTPKDIVDLVGLVEEHATRSGSGAPTAGGNPGGTNAPSLEEQQLRAQMLKVFPELQSVLELPGALEQQTAARQQQAKAHSDALAARGMVKLKEMAKKAGYSDDIVPQLESVLATLIAKDEGLHGQWGIDPAGVVERAFTNYQEQFVTPVARAQATGPRGVKRRNAEELAPTLPSGSGAPGGTQPEPKPKNLEEAASVAERFLESHGAEFPLEEE